MQDSQIVALYFSRDERAITETNSKYHSYLKKISMNILNSEEDSEESINDTYLAAWDSIPPSCPRILSSYLAKLIRRIAIDMYRKRNRDKRRSSEYALSLSELSEAISTDPLPEDELEALLLAEKISEFLKAQKADVRRAFVGRYFFLDSVKDVARYCNMTESRLKTLLHRTRISLKKHLEKEGFDV